MILSLYFWSNPDLGNWVRFVCYGCSDWVSEWLRYKRLANEGVFGFWVLFLLLHFGCCQLNFCSDCNCEQWAPPCFCQVHSRSVQFYMHVNSYIDMLIVLISWFTDQKRVMGWIKFHFLACLFGCWETRGIYKYVNCSHFLVQWSEKSNGFGLKVSFFFLRLFGCWETWGKGRKMRLYILWCSLILL